MNSINDCYNEFRISKILMISKMTYLDNLLKNQSVFTDLALKTCKLFDKMLFITRVIIPMIKNGNWLKNI